MFIQEVRKPNCAHRLSPIQHIAKPYFQKAALLRSTLQTAMRSITDHQIDRRVSDLEEHSRKCPRISSSAFSSPLPALSFRKPATPQFHTPRIGSMLDMSSTPTQQTPDLPFHYSSIKNTAMKLQSTPLYDGGSPMQLSSPPETVIHRSTDEVEDQREEGQAGSRGRLSPSQRGDAVDGLLKLMSTADRHDSSDAWNGS